MTTTTTRRRLMPVLAALLTAGALTTSGLATAPRFLNDDPVWQELDTQDASGLKADEVNLFVDAGSVAPRLDEIDLGKLHTSHGVGLTFHTTRQTAFRMEVARSNEGLGLVFSFSPRF